MSKSSVVKTVGGVTTKITTMSTVHTSSSQQRILQQQQQQQQQMKQNVNTVQPQYIMDTRKGQQISTTSSFQNNRQNQHYDEPAPRMEIQQPRTENMCVRCKLPVYKMVEVIAENRVWHRKCFRCNKCDKQLNRHSKVDSFQIHNGVAYCKYHFLQLFGKNDAALPSHGLVRPSEQNHVGRENIQNAAGKTSFQIPGKMSKTEKEESEELQQNIGIIRGSTVLSKMQKFHAKGMDVGDVGVQDLKPNEKERINETYDDESIYSEDFDDETDVDLLRAKRLQRERPLRIDDMDEIKNKFEGGIEQGREARFLERKQNVQDSRSRIYLGKQARTRDLYENAVERLKNSPKLRNRGLLLAYELDNVKAAAEKTQNVKQRFESGDVYRRDTKSVGREFHDSVHNKVSERMQKLAKQQAQDESVKSSSKVQFMDTAQILNRFEFFENTNPDKQKGSHIKIDGININGLRINGAVEKAKNAYIGRINKNKAKGRKSF